MNTLAFDCYDTVFDASRVSPAESRSYVDQVRRPEWAPLDLPPSFWNMPAHPDAAEGIRRLRAQGFRVVTCSNLPLELLHTLSQESGIVWDAIVPLAANRAYKPDRRAYFTVCQVLQVEPSDVAIVTAHPHGPDISGSAAAGMGCYLIRNGGFAKDVIELSERITR